MLTAARPKRSFTEFCGAEYRMVTAGWLAPYPPFSP